MKHYKPKPRRIRTEEHYAGLRENRKLVYQDRKARQVCIDCEAPLAPDDGQRCEKCEGRHRLAKELYDATPRGRAVRKYWQRRYYAKRKKADCCTQCGTPRAQWAKVPGARIRKMDPKRKTKLCDICRKRATDAMKRYRKRKREGVVVLATEKRKRDREKLRVLRGDAYTPLDELLEQPRVKILRTLVRRGWIAQSVLFELMSVPPADDDGSSKARDRYTQRLSVLRRAGYVDRREGESVGFIRDNEYRITEAGRTWLDGYLRKAS